MFDICYCWSNETYISSKNVSASILQPPYSEHTHINVVLCGIEVLLIIQSRAVLSLASISYSFQAVHCRIKMRTASGRINRLGRK